MQYFKIVTLCISNTGDRNEYIYSKSPTRFKSRNKSAPFYSEFKPVVYSQLKENCPKIIKMTDFPARNRTDSLVSPRLKKEIKSAVLLIENRSKNDVFKLEKDRLLDVKLNDCNTCNRNRLSKSAKSVIQNKTERDINRWQSANGQPQRINHYSGINENSAKIHYKILTLKDENQEKFTFHKSNNQKSSVINELPRVSGNKLVTSISNSLTNFLTIDEIYGVKSEWEDRESGNLESPKINTEIEVEKYEKKQPLSNRNKRECVLRDYLNVYLNWRTSKSIQEHQDFICGKTGHSRIRTAIPKSRLAMFHKIIDEQQTQLSTKKIKELHSSKMEVPKLRTRDIISPKVFNHHTKSTTPRKNEISNVLNSQEVIDHENGLAPLVMANESDSEDGLEEYSEIDWLQCEDI